MKVAAEDLVPEAVIGELILANSLVLTCVCDEDNVRKGRFVTATTWENWPPVVHEADSGEPVFGTALKSGNSGDYIPVCIFGIVKMYAGGAVSAGAGVKTDNDGRAVAALASDDGKSGGRALMSASEANDQFIVLVCPDNHGVGT
ncbi:DUF2190 family protein [Candidatus Bathyarchaeota archaeon]|nr:DUF2190 family protein [Candidatus Bathyarchaeota archaeon]